MAATFCCRHLQMSVIASCHPSRNPVPGKPGEIIRMAKVQSSNLKVQSSNLKVQSSNLKVQSTSGRHPTAQLMANNNLITPCRTPTLISRGPLIIVFCNILNLVFGKKQGHVPYIYYYFG